MGATKSFSWYRLSMGGVIYFEGLSIIFSSTCRRVFAVQYNAIV